MSVQYIKSTWVIMSIHMYFGVFRLQFFEFRGILYERSERTVCPIWNCPLRQNLHDDESQQIVSSYNMIYMYDVVPSPATKYQKLNDELAFLCFWVPLFEKFVPPCWEKYLIINNQRNSLHTTAPQNSQSRAWSLRGPTSLPNLPTSRWFERRGSQVMYTWRWEVKNTITHAQPRSVLFFLLVSWDVVENYDFENAFHHKISCMHFALHQQRTAKRTQTLWTAALSVRFRSHHQQPTILRRHSSDTEVRIVKNEPCAITTTVETSHNLKYSVR